MEIKQSSYTCSLIELGRISYKIPSGFTKEDLKIMIMRELQVTQSFFTNKRNILCNVNYTKTEELYKQLRKLGFKVIHCYEGNSGPVAMMLLDLNKKTWREKIISWLSK